MMQNVYWKNLNGYSLANSEDPVEMPQNAAFHQRLHFLLRLKQTSWTEVHLNQEILACNSLVSCTINHPMLIVSHQINGIYMWQAGYPPKSVDFGAFIETNKHKDSLARFASLQAYSSGFQS